MFPENAFCFDSMAKMMNWKAQGRLDPMDGRWLVICADAGAPT